MTHCKVASVRLSDILFRVIFSNKHKFHALMFSYSNAKDIINSFFIQPHSFASSSLSHNLADSTLSYFGRKIIKHLF